VTRERKRNARDAEVENGPGHLTDSPIFDEKIIKPGMHISFYVQWYESRCLLGLSGETWESYAFKSRWWDHLSINDWYFKGNPNYHMEFESLKIFYRVNIDNRELGLSRSPVAICDILRNYLNSSPISSLDCPSQNLPICRASAYWSWTGFKVRPQQCWNHLHTDLPLRSGVFFFCKYGLQKDSFL
jgi:hypothetical protein